MINFGVMPEGEYASRAIIINLKDSPHKIDQKTNCNIVLELELLLKFPQVRLSGQLY
jgi:hypothetical protein